MARHWELGSRLRRTQYGRYTIGIHEGGSEAPLALISTAIPYAEELALEIVVAVNAARDKAEAEEEDAAPHRDWASSEAGQAYARMIERKARGE